jgi:tetratricopeptide (TPR) repeat protein
MSCVQAEAALLPVARPEDVRGIRFRKGYCTLAAATVTGEKTTFEDAASEFDKAGMPAIAAIVRRQILPGSPVNLPACPDALIPVAFCEGLKATAHQWMGYDALKSGNLLESGTQFSAGGGYGWSELVRGHQDFQTKRYREAVMDYRSAVDLARRAPVPSPERLGPRLDIGATLTDLGGAQVAAGDRAGAITTLDEALKVAPSTARAAFLRATAKREQGNLEAALADYNMASRFAFAGAVDLASGEAHLYRGIGLYYRKEYGRAEDEFASALNFEISAKLRNEAETWRHLSAVAGGSCGASRDLLDRSLPSVSPYFPVSDARSRLAACATVLNKE